MKALLKKSLMFSALVLMSASVSTVVNAATGVFQWSGVAPTENVSKGICIKKTNRKNSLIDHHSGMIAFHNPSNNNTTHDVKSSSELTFNVGNYDTATKACNGDLVTFNYSLMRLMVKINGGNFTEQGSDSEWKIHHSKNGTAAEKLTGIKLAHTADIVALTVAGTGVEVAAGDSVIVQAFILIETS